MGVYFDANGKRVTEMVDEDVFIIGKLIDGVQKQKTILKTDVLPQAVGPTDSVEFISASVQDLNVVSTAFVGGLTLGAGNPVTTAAVVPTKRMQITVNGVDYYIALQPVE